VLPVWKVLAGVLLAEVLFHSCIHTYNLLRNSHRRKNGFLSCLLRRRCR
jgi:hypothetical protein